MPFRVSVLLIAVAFLTACNLKSHSQASQAAAEAARANAAGVPPVLLSADLLTDRRIVLTGRAAPGLRVRLATPQGEALFAAADDDGVWRMTLPPSPALRLFGLSMQDANGQRSVQAEGYLAVTPEGTAAQLRSGAGAVVIARPTAGLRILAVDFDRQGGAVVSGHAAPGVSVSARVDGVQRGQAASDAEGRFSVALSEPLGRGQHDLEAADGESRIRAVAAASPAPALTQAPFRAERDPMGWRIDWMTPGGGVQSTLIMTTPEPAA